MKQDDAQDTYIEAGEGGVLVTGTIEAVAQGVYKRDSECAVKITTVGESVASIGTGAPGALPTLFGGRYSGTINCTK